MLTLGVNIFIHSIFFQVKKKFEGVHDMFVGDFLCCGAEQVLLLYTDASHEDRMESYLITDFATFNFHTKVQMLM